jgi:gamma-glutamylcyclotransferase (GGCT)/AIG2-like uncharacterized protein YtfP
MRFFFYGTLIAGSGSEVARAVHDMLRPIGPATARGALYAVGDPRGWYPVLLPGREQVHGMHYESTADFGRAELARLDAYEDFDPRDPARSLYLRREISVTGADGARRKAQAYRYNRALPASARPIPGGDFHAWLEETGLIPFGGLRSV